MGKKRNLSVEEAEKIRIIIKTGSIDEFKCLFSSDFHFNAELSKNQGSSPIHVAAQLGRLDIIEFLLASGVDVKKTDLKGWTPLHYAVEASKLAVINRLIKVSVKAVSNSGAPFHNAAYNQSTKDINKNIKSNLNVVNKEGNTPLHIACNKGNEEVVHLLLNAYEKIPEIKRNLSKGNKLGDTPLHVACRKGKEVVLNLLLNALEKIPVAKRNLSIVNKWKWTPLHFACHSRDEAVVKLLLNALEKVPENDRKLSAVSKCGNTPLHIACEKGNEKVVSLLLDALEKVPTAKYNLTMVNAYENTPLYIACQRGNSSVAELLLNALEKIPESERNLSVVNKAGETPLYAACRLGKEFLVRLLLNALEKIPETMRKLEEGDTPRGCRGDTPLHVACRRGHTSVISLLLDAGARSDIKNRNGEKPLYLYLSKKKFLEEHELATLEKMSFTDINTDKMSAAHFALRFLTHLETVKSILCLQKNLNVLDLWGNTPLNYMIDELEKDTEHPFINIRLLINCGAYFTPKDCKRIVKNHPFRNYLFTDVELCAESCLNKLINAAIPTMYNSLLSTHLPPREKLITNSVYLPKLKTCVETDIKCRGYCDFENMVYPLFYLSVIRLSNYCEKQQISSSQVKKKGNKL